MTTTTTTTTQMSCQNLEARHSRNGASRQEYWVSPERIKHRTTNSPRTRPQRHSDPIPFRTKPVTTEKDMPAASWSTRRRKDILNKSVKGGEVDSQGSERSFAVVDYEGERQSFCDTEGNIENGYYGDEKSNRGDERNFHDEENSVRDFAANRRPLKCAPDCVNTPRTPPPMGSAIRIPVPGNLSPPNSKSSAPAPNAPPRVFLESRPFENLDTALSPTAELKWSKSLQLLTMNETPARGSKADFTTEWSHIQEKRMSVLAQRSRIYEMRSALRNMQQTKSTAEDRMIQWVRAREMGARLPMTTERYRETLMQLLDDVQPARDDYGLLEFECNQLEDQLYREEFELHKQEVQLFSRWDIAPAQRHASGQVRQEQFEAPSTLDGEETEDDDDAFHPLVIKYLSCKGDLDILREQYGDLEDEQEDLVGRRESRMVVGISFAPEDQAKWENLPIRRQNLLAQIEQRENEAQFLQTQCFEMRLLDDDGDPNDWSTKEWKEIKVDDETNQNDDDSSSAISEYSKHPQLLSEANYEPFNPKIEKTAYTTLVQINLWILASLQSSAVEVNHLARFSEGKGGKYGSLWEGAVLSLWLKDDIVFATPVQVYSSSLTTQAPALPEDLGYKQFDLRSLRIQPQPWNSTYNGYENYPQIPSKSRLEETRKGGVTSWHSR